MNKGYIKIELKFNYELDGTSSVDCKAKGRNLKTAESAIALASVVSHFCNSFPDEEKDEYIDEFIKELFKNNHFFDAIEIHEIKE